MPGGRLQQPSDAGHCSVPSVAVVVVVVASDSPVAAVPEAVTVVVAPAAIAYSQSKCALLTSVSIFHYNKGIS